MLTPLEQHYNKHKEELRLQRRHGQVEFQVTMQQIRRSIAAVCPDSRPARILDVGAGTGHYAIQLKAEGHQVDCVELVRRNIDVMLKADPTLNVRQGDARRMDWIADAQYDAVLLLGPLYHLVGDADKLSALLEAKRVVRPGGVIFVAYLMNEYSILSYCFAEERMPRLMSEGVVDADFHVRTLPGELYDYVRLDDINRLNAAAGLRRLRIFSPDGAADFMRTSLNRMTPESFRLFIDYQMQVCERPELIGAGSHTVDVITKWGGEVFDMTFAKKHEHKTH